MSTGWLNLVPTNTFAPNLNTSDKKDNDNEDDNGGVPWRFPLRSTSQANRNLSSKKSLEDKSKALEKPTPKKGEVRKTNVKIKKPTMQ